jgi:hypothetical protein
LYFSLARSLFRALRAQYNRTGAALDADAVADLVAGDDWLQLCDIEALEELVTAMPGFVKVRFG